MAYTSGFIRMGVSVSDQEVVEALTRMGKLDKRRIMHVIGADMKISTKNNFKEARDPVTGKRWSGLRPVTQMSKPKKSGNPLQDTTRLLRSINSAKPDVSENSVQIGTNVEYARIHQQGGVIKAKRAKYLTIPVDPAARKAKTFQRFWDQCVAKGQSPELRGRRGAPALVMVYYKGARAARSNIKTKKTTKAFKGKETVGFILKKSIVIPRRRFMGFSFKDKNQVVQRFKEGVLNAENRKLGATAPQGKEYW